MVNQIKNLPRDKRIKEGKGESQKHTEKEERRVGVVFPPPENFGGVVEGKI